LITSTTSGSEPGGTINLAVGSLSISKRSFIGAFSWGEGQAGAINITAGSIVLDDTETVGTQRGISTSTAGSGNGGTIAITTGTLDLRGGTLISSGSEDVATGDAGNILIAARDIFMSQGAVVESSAIGVGRAGSVTMTADNLFQINSGARVSVSAAQSDGGDISLTANLLCLNHGILTAQADGNGGNIKLTSPYVIHLQDSQVTAHAVHGDGGNVNIDPVFVVLGNSGLVASAIEGNGGNVTIITDYYLNSASTIDVSSEFGLTGSIAITAPALDLSSNLETLQADLLNADALLQPHCGMKLPGGVSSFVVRGRGGRPVEPGLLLPVMSAASIENAK
jgi:hypothetical protein